MGGKTREGTSPVRVSRLKKRRRQKESNDGTNGTNCALQNLPTPSEKKRPTSRHNCNAIANQSSNGQCKENMLNGLPPFSERASGGGNYSEFVDDGKGGGGWDKNALHRAGTSIQSASTKFEIDGQSLTTNIKKSTLEFMDSMEPTALLSAIPSMLGIDMERYNSTSSFQQDLELAFEYKANHTGKSPSKKLQYASSRDKGIYHSLVGRIDPHSRCVSPDEHSIAFPRCRNLAEEEHQDDHMGNYLQHLNLSRKSSHGMCIPSSWYQFPMPKTQQPRLPEKTSENGDDNRLSSAKLKKKELSEGRNPPSLDFLSEYRAGSTKRNGTEQSARGCTLPTVSVSPANRTDNQEGAKANAKNISTMTSESLPSPPKYKGAIQIVSQKGATVREAFDIDKSNRVVGKLNHGEKRYFIEKKTLPPPPISLLDESDEEDDDECVAVVRYKILLNSADRAAGGCNEKVGWISDRGRFADEPYLILKEN